MTETSHPGPRIVFLDVDGTYADHGEVPPGHAAAVRAARANGHRVLLCTGRPKIMLPERLRAAGFDGIVASAGGYVEVADQVLSDRRFPAELAAHAVRVLDRRDVAYVLEAPDALYGPPGVVERLDEVWERRRLVDAEAARHEGPIDILSAMRTGADLTGVSFAKITCFDSTSPVPEVAAEIGAGVAALPSSIPGMGEGSGEIYLADVHKAVGIRQVVAHLGIDRAQVIAAGDGLNDLEMLAYAGIGVAIEGADPRVLAVADRVVPGPRDEGLVQAFTELGLIDGV